MKTAIHPQWTKDTKVTCACGNSFTLGSTVQEINVEVCSACHPFYTGQMKFVDTAGRVDAFRARLKAANKTVVSKADRRQMKREKKIEEQLNRPETLDEIRKSLKKSQKPAKA